MMQLFVNAYTPSSWDSNNEFTAYWIGKIAFIPYFISCQNEFELVSSILKASNTARTGLVHLLMFWENIWYSCLLFEFEREIDHLESATGLYWTIAMDLLIFWETYDIVTTCFWLCPSWLCLGFPLLVALYLAWALSYFLSNMLRFSCFWAENLSETASLSHKGRCRCVSDSLQTHL